MKTKTKITTRKVAIGDRFGRLEVIAEAPKMNGSYRWQVRCECGVEKPVHQQQLLSVNSRTVSCGCYGREQTKKINTKHGGCAGGKTTPEYSTWTSMRSRCNNPDAPGYATHGGRGIQVCDRWDDFACFLSDMGDRPSLDHSLDRINNDGNYEPGNCRWATAIEQANNTRRSARCLINGQYKNLREMAALAGVSRGTMRKRLRDMSPEQAVCAPRFSVQKRRTGTRLYLYKGEMLSVAELARIAGLCWPSMLKRLSRLPPEEAVIANRKAVRNKGRLGHRAPVAVVA